MTTWGLRESSRACATMSAVRNVPLRYRRLNPASMQCVWLENIALASTSLTEEGHGHISTKNPHWPFCSSPRWRLSATHPGRPPPRSPSGPAASPAHGTARRSGRPAPCGEDRAKRGKWGHRTSGRGLPGLLHTGWALAPGRKCHRDLRRAPAAPAARKPLSSRYPSWRSRGSHGLSGSGGGKSGERERERERWGTMGDGGERIANGSHSPCSIGGMQEACTGVGRHSPICRACSTGHGAIPRSRNAAMPLLTHPGDFRSPSCSHWSPSAVPAQPARPSSCFRRRSDVPSSSRGYWLGWRSPWRWRLPAALGVQLLPATCLEGGNGVRGGCRSRWAGWRGG